MLNLYKVTFRAHFTFSLYQPINVSARNKPQALKRARAFIESHYSEMIRHESTEKICRTPDDVLDWN
jgi:hypothetical protein